MADDTWSRAPITSAVDPKTANAISAARKYLGGPLAGSPVANGFGNMPAAKPQAGGCANGGAGGPGEAQGAANNGALDDSGLDSGLKNAFGCAQQKWETANPGMKVYAFSGVSDRPSNPSSRHPSGNAMDVAIYGTDGQMLNNLRGGDTPAYRAYESFASAMHECYTGAGGDANSLRWGGNFGGTWYHDAMHFDVGGGPTARGDIRTGAANPLIPNNSRPQDGIVYNGPKEGAAANAGGAGEAQGAANNNALTSKGNTSGANCGSQNSGCKPISAATPAAAASLAKGAGLSAMPAGVQQAMQAVTGGTGGALAAGLQQAAAAAAGFTNPAAILGTVTNGLGGIGMGAIQAVASGGLPNVLGGITSGVLGKIQGLGGGLLQSLNGMGGGLVGGILKTGVGTLSSLTGVIPMALATGNVKGLMTGVISSTVGNVIRENVPQLGGFANVFGAAAGAVAGGANVKQVLMGSAMQMFGRATNGVLGTPSLIPGYSNLNLLTAAVNLTAQDEGSESIGGDLITHWKPAVDATVNFTAPMGEVLPKVVRNGKVNAFSSLFMDYNSFVTQGIGNLTDHIVGLGMDLLCLGKVGDLQDLLNIGTARQLARQLIENGLGLSSGLIAKLKEQDLTPDDLFDDQNEPLVFEILQSIDSPEALLEIADVMLINESIPLDNVADLLLPEKVLNYSKDYARFVTFNDMALTLALCLNGTGRLKTFGDLGLLLMNMETAENMPELLDEYTLIRPDEKEELMQDLPPISRFGTTGPTIADLIGTAAGYVHDQSLPKMAEMHEEIFTNAYFADFRDLMSLLTETLNGDYTTTTINPPSVGSYSFGSYSALDDAASDIADAIETELERIATDLPTDDPTLWKKVNEYESLHVMSCEFLAHEKKMRQAYGVDFGESRLTEYFYGDGTTTQFTLHESVAEVPNILVVQNGVTQRQYSDWTYADSKVTFTTAPAAAVIVTIAYDTGYIKPQASAVDTWNFVSNLEAHALETGYGGPAEFLNRMVKDDMHGQRIKSIMMQSRNKVRLENVGIGCPGFNRLLNEDDSKFIDFTSATGIWSEEPNRAAEIYVQLRQNVDSSKEYYVSRLQQSVEALNPEKELLMNNVTRQLLFEMNGKVVGSDKLVELYNNFPAELLFSPEKLDIDLTFDEDNLPSGGIIIGPFSEIVSQLIKYEGMTNNVFNSELSASTKDYLERVGINLELLTSLCQRVLQSSLASHLGISEEDARGTFGVQSISKSLLINTTNGY